jgi:hypothetical protein
MKKELFIGAVFLAMLASSLFNIRCVKTLTEDVTRSVELAADAAASGDWDLSESCAIRAFTMWRSHSAHTQLVLRHSAIEAAENSIILMLTEVYAKDAARVLGTAEAARRVMESIAETERVRFGSVF